MKILHKANLLREEILAFRKQGFSIAFIPTMGALHAGHMSLIAQALSQAKTKVVASVFVNPTQFDKAEDLEKYPRTLEKDAAMLKENGCDLLFAPEVEEMYTSAIHLRFDFGFLEKVMDGKHRRGHFKTPSHGRSRQSLFWIKRPSTSSYYSMFSQGFGIQNRDRSLSYFKRKEWTRHVLTKRKAKFGR